MSGRVKYIKLKESIIIHYGLKTETLSFSHPKYNEVIKAIEEGKEECIPYILQYEDRRAIKKLLKFKS